MTTAGGRSERPQCRQSAGRIRSDAGRFRAHGNNFRIDAQYGIALIGASFIVPLRPLFTNNDFNLMNDDVADAPARYGLIAILLHWVVAVLIFAAFALGVVMVDIPGLTPTKLRYFSWHKWLGVTVLALAALRLLWRGWRGAPPAVVMPRWQQRASSAGHALLYLLMFVVPLSGYFYSLAAGVPVVYLGVWPLPVLMEADPVWKPILKQLHITLVYVLFAVVVVHLLAVIKHQWIDRDGLLRRMLP